MFVCSSQRFKHPPANKKNRSENERNNRKDNCTPLASFGAEACSSSVSSRCDPRRSAGGVPEHPSYSCTFTRPSDPAIPRKKKKAGFCCSRLESRRRVHSILQSVVSSMPPAFC